MCWQSGYNTRPNANQFPEHGYDHRSLTSQLNEALIRKLRGSSMCLAYIIDMVCMGVCISRHSQLSGRLLQELNVCTVSCLCASLGELTYRLVFACSGMAWQVTVGLITRKRDVGYSMYTNRQMTLYSRINPVRHLNCICQ